MSVAPKKTIDKSKSAAEKYKILIEKLKAQLESIQALLDLYQKQRPVMWVPSYSYREITERPCEEYRLRYVVGAQRSPTDTPLYKMPVSPVVPQGWKLVPVIATDAMADAAWDKYERSHTAKGAYVHRPSEIYTAMISVAPEYKP